jgi:hypothetical protein
MAVEIKGGFELRFAPDPEEGPALAALTAALKLLAEEGEALASLDGHTVLLRRVDEP